MIKQFPKAVNMRMIKLTSNKKISPESSKMYIEPLKKSGFKEEFTYLEPNKIKPNNNIIICIKMKKLLIIVISK